MEHTLELLVVPIKGNFIGQLLERFCGFTHQHVLSNGLCLFRQFNVVQQVICMTLSRSSSGENEPIITRHDDSKGTHMLKVKVHFLMPHDPKTGYVQKPSMALL